MARKAQPDGVIGTLQRLFGHDDDRSLLAKLAGTSPLKRYVLESGSNVFKRSIQCDNLIKNMLALDTVFNSQEFVCKLANGEVKPAEISEKIQAAKARLEKKMQAYAYWVDRIDSLEKVLTNATGFEEFALEDRLSIDVQGRSLDTGSPYALRAVRLLEQVEERGRNSLLNADQLNEKAWALYRLGVHEQAVGLAQQAVEIEPTHAEAWLLQALHSLTQKRSAQGDMALYEFEKEQAEPLSGHEYWADEMRDAAEDRMAAALGMV